MSEAEELIAEREAHKRTQEDRDRLLKLFAASENWRKAYQDGKYKLYEMGGEICEAAAEHLPMSEGPLDRWSRKYLIDPGWQDRAIELTNKAKEAEELRERLRALVGNFDLAATGFWSEFKSNGDVELRGKVDAYAYCARQLSAALQPQAKEE